MSSAPPNPAWSIEETVAQRWSRLVAWDPDGAAVVLDQGPDITRVALDAWSDAVAAAVAATGGEDTAPAAVLVTHDERVAAAVLGVLKSGRPVVVLDAAAPAPRTRAISEAAGATVCVVDGASRELGRALGVPLVDLDSCPRTGCRPELPVRGPDDVAYLPFTSGSTGTPKGVVHAQRTVLHDALLRVEAGWSRYGDDVAMLLPVAFAGGFGVLMTALLSGASLHFLDPRTSGTSRLRRWLYSRSISVLPMTPALLRGLLDELAPGELLPGSLRLVTSTGEALPGDVALAVLARLPETARLVNLVGSSETCLYAAYDVPRSFAGGPAGAPAGNAVRACEITLLDDEGREVAPGERGWVHVTSRYLPLGYWRDPGMSAARFMRASDGSVTVRTGDLGRRFPDAPLELLGRGDFTLKIRGYRVDPVEVERALLALPDVVEAVVTGQEDPRRGVRLVAHVALLGNPPPRQGVRLRSLLRATLPAYLVPEAVVVVDRLPRTERGKVDRSALPPALIAPGSADYAPPRTEWEQALASLWAEVLGVPAVGIHDDFFSLGGDSLASEELLVRLRTSDHVEATSKLLAQYPTIAEFAQHVTSRREERYATLVPVQTSGSRRPLFCVAGAGGVGLGFVPLARRLGPDQPVWGLQAKGLEGGGFPDWSMQAHARRHIEAIRSVQPTGPYRIAGFSFGCAVACEMAHQLRAAGQEVELLVLLDGYAPAPEYVHRRPRNRVMRLREWLSVWVTGFVSNGHGRGHFGRFFLHGDYLLRRYRGTPWTGRALLVVGEPGGEGDRAAGWEKFLLGPTRLVRVPGEHLSLLHEPNVGPLAAEVADELDLLGPRDATEDESAARAVHAGG